MENKFKIVIEANHPVEPIDLSCPSIVAIKKYKMFKNYPGVKKILLLEEKDPYNYKVVRMFERF